MILKVSSLQIDQGLIRAYLYTFHTHSAFIVIHISEAIYFIKSIHWANKVTSATFSASHDSYLPIFMFHKPMIEKRAY